MKETELKPKIEMTKLMNLLNDWSFKYIWSKEKNLIHFLNLLFRGKEEIKSIVYLPTEQIKKREKDRQAVFDVFCKNDRDELILLEMQNLKQEHFEDRSLYYSTFSIQKQAIRGKWNFELKAVYVIGILNFVYITLPKFNKKLEEITNRLDYWLYILRHSKEMKSQPEIFREEIFDELFEDIEVEQLSEEKMEAYRSSELRYEDLYNYTNYAKKEGRMEGLLEGEIKSKIEISKKLQEMRMPISEISKITGLTQKQILNLPK
jgi:hypothetical protein